MPKLTRKTQKIFAKDGGAIGQFGSAQALSPTLTADPAVIQSLPAYESGWNDAVISGQKRPPLEEFNGLKYVNDYQNAYLFQEGIPEYDAATTYYQNSLVKESGTTNIYKSLTDDNIGNALSNNTDWELQGNLKHPRTQKIINSRSDFNFVVEGSKNVATLDSTLAYIIGQDITLQSNDVFRSSAGSIYMSGVSPSFKNKIYQQGSGTFFEMQNNSVYINIRDLQFESELGGSLGNFTGFNAATGGVSFFDVLFKNVNYANFNSFAYLIFGIVIFEDCYNWQLSNIGGWSLGDKFLIKNFADISGDIFTIDGFIGQSNATVVATVTARPNMRIFNIKPSLDPNSDISIGTALPYDGLQLAPLVNFSDAGGGATRIVTAWPHAYPTGRVISIQNSSNYNGGFPITVIDPVTFTIPTPFVKEDATPIAITAIADNGSGGSTITSANHGYSNGKFIEIINTLNYNGFYTVFNVVPNVSYDIRKTFTINETVGFSRVSPVAVLLNVAATAPELVPFFREATKSGTITAYASNGAGGTTVSSTTTPDNGESILIQGDSSLNYDGGYRAFNVVAGVSFDIAKPFVANDAQGTWNNASLNGSDTRVTVTGAGGILSDSQSVGQMNTSASVTVTVPAVNTTTLVNDATTGGTNIFSSATTTRFKLFRSLGRLVYIGKEPISVFVQATLTVAKAGGGSNILGALIAKNGVDVDRSESTTENSTPTGIVCMTQQSLVTGDYLELKVVNRSTSSGIVISRANFIVRK